MLAVKLEMSDKLPKLEEGKKTSSYSSAANASPTAKMLDEWEERGSSTIGKLTSFGLFHTGLNVINKFQHSNATLKKALWLVRNSHVTWNKKQSALFQRSVVMLRWKTALWLVRNSHVTWNKKESALFQRSIVMLCWKKALWLVKNSHMTWNKKTECFISA